MPESTSSVVPLDALPGIPALARGLATGTPDVSAFLPDRPDLATIAARAARVVAAFSARAPSRADAEHLDLVVGHRAGIFTGQQVGLFSGPLLTVVKALAAVKLARDLSAAGVAATPAFWCAAEDHDLVEVTRFAVPTAEGFRDAGPPEGPLVGNRTPVGDLKLGVNLDDVLEAAAAGLGGDAHAELSSALRELVSGHTFREAFVSVLRWLLPEPELVFVDAARRDDKPDLVPLAARLVRERETVARLLSERGAALVAAGHPIQVVSDPAALPLFSIVDGERLLLRRAGERLALKGGGDDTFSAEEVVARFESGEWLPSFSALTRPLAASVLFPVAATILGPAEIAYWAQSYPLFAWAGIVPPVLVPRPMVALVDPASKKALEKLGLDLPALLRGPEAILKERAEHAAGATLAKLAELRASALQRLAELQPELLAIDATLEKPVEATRQNLDFAFGKLAEKASAAAGRKDETFARQLAKVAASLLPGGKLAERVFTPVPYLLRFGRDALMGSLERELRWDTPGLRRIDL